MIEKIRKNLQELGFAGNEIRAYIALTQLGESVASKVAKKAGLKRTTVISILEKLQENNFVSAHKYRGVTSYWIESPKTIKKIFENRVAIAEELNGLLGDLYRDEADFPNAKIFDTRLSIKNFIEKTVVNLEKKSVLYTIDTPSMGNYEKIYSDDFRMSLYAIKKKRDITTKTLVPHGAYAGIDPKKIKAQKILIREMPEGLKFKAAIWIIKDTLILFSGKYPFIVSVKHRMITGSFKGIYDYLWSVSVPMD
jgi:hypothetical protein